ncbi:hypothetical protein J6590_054044 [Homalodisca vitripennis]|nr:hypothetical protein J6590_054044 [Homalodisca vitripennis]
MSNTTNHEESSLQPNETDEGQTISHFSEVNTATTGWSKVKKGILPRNVKDNTLVYKDSFYLLGEHDLEPESLKSRQPRPFAVN